jgi:WD40 repeat protein
MGSSFSNFACCVPDRTKENKNLNKIRTEIITNSLSLPHVLTEIIISYDHYYFEGKLIKSFGTGFHTITAIAVHPDGFPERIINGSLNGTIKVWNMNTEKCEMVCFGHSQQVSCIEFLPNGYVVSGSFDKMIKIWDLNDKFVQLQRQDGNPLPINLWKFTLQGHTDIIKCITVLANGFIVSGSRDQTLRIWNVYTKTCKNILAGPGGHTDSVSCVTSLPNYPVELIISGSYDRTIKIWDSTNGLCNMTIACDNLISCVSILPNGLIAYGSIFKLMSFDPKNKKHKCLYDEIIRSEHCTAIVVARSANAKIISLWSEGMMVISDLGMDSKKQYSEKNGVKHIFTEFKHRVDNIAAHPNGYLISGSLNGTIQVWK